MTDAWRRGARDASVRSPLQGGESGGPGGPLGDEGGRAERRSRLGVGQPSGNPGRHRTFEVRAAYRAAAGGWVAQVREENRNEQLEGRGMDPHTGGQVRSFPSAATYLGEAVRAIIDAEERTW